MYSSWVDWPNFSRIRDARAEHVPLLWQDRSQDCRRDNPCNQAPHGWPYAWARLPDGIAGSRHFLRLSLPGFGQSNCAKGVEQFQFVIRWRESKSMVQMPAPAPARRCDLQCLLRIVIQRGVKSSLSTSVSQ